MGCGFFLSIKHHQTAISLLLSWPSWRIHPGLTDPHLWWHMLQGGSRMAISPGLCAVRGRLLRKEIVLVMGMSIWQRFLGGSVCCYPSYHRIADPQQDPQKRRTALWACHFCGQALNSDAWTTQDAESTSLKSSFKSAHVILAICEIITS